MDRIIEKKKGLKPKTIAIIAGALVLVFLIVKIMVSSGSSSYRVEADKLTISPVEQGSFKDYISII